jgi:hypothetical protein
MKDFSLEMLPQPTDESCGSTCLHAIYQYYGEVLDLEQLIKEIPHLDTGGTLAVALGIHALKRGYRAIINTYNVQVFDPTWFKGDKDIRKKLQMQMEYKKDPKLQWASKAYLRFLDLGGEIRMDELDEHVLRTYFDQRLPILTGLNATYLYRTPREFGNEFDDVRGTSMGHFVVMYGYDPSTHKVLIADPYRLNPISNSTKYRVEIKRVINSILLGIITYDANFLVIQRGKGGDEE